MWVLGRHSTGVHSAFYIICQMSSINTPNHVLDLSNYYYLENPEAKTLLVSPDVICSIGNTKFRTTDITNKKEKKKKNSDSLTDFQVPPSV